MEGYQPLPGDLVEKLTTCVTQNKIPFLTLFLSAFSSMAFRYCNEERITVTVMICSIKPGTKRQTPALGSENNGLKISVQLEATTTGNTLFTTITKQLVENVLSINSLLDIGDNVDYSCSWMSDDASAVEMVLDCKARNGFNFLLSSPGKLTSAVMYKHEHFLVLLNALAQQPEKPIGTIALLSESESLLLRQFSTTLVDETISAPDCIHRFFEKNARNFPNQPALRCKGVETTYENLNWKANSLAVRMRALGIGRGSTVALLLPRSDDVFLAMLAVLKSGAAYVPIDPRSPQDRIKFMLDDAKVSLVITDHDLENQNNLQCSCLFMDDATKTGLGTFQTENPSLAETGITPSDPAYIIYTSGTTGKPKGVVVTHQAACNLVRGESVLFNVNKNDRVFQGFSVSFDASIEEIWLAWFSGAVLVVGTKAEVLSGPDLAAFLQTENITVFSTVPTQISMMTTPVESVRILILGGEECHLRFIEPWFNGKRQIFNTYGPTEATVIATCGTCLPNKKPSIGKAAPNYAVYILDQNKQPQPIGVIGDLYIGGHSLATGYLNRPDLTREKFISPPFVVGNGFPDRLYKSGDRARFSPNGTIEFAGRADDQIKLRGQRIELGEIESALLKIPSIAQSAVSVHTNSQQIQTLVAYLVPQENALVDERVIKTILKQFLPAYMIPAVFCRLESMPRLPSGKVDRKKLPLPQDLLHAKCRETIAPRNPTEKTIAASWEKYFDRRDISVTDDFFDLGGHSLLAAMIVSQLRTFAGMEHLPLQSLYQHRTIETLAKHIDGQNIKNINNAAPPVEQSAGQKKSRSTWRRVLCGMLQSVALYPVYFLFAMPLLLPFILDWLIPDLELPVWVTASFIGFSLLYPALLIVSIIVKWTVIGRFKEGTYPLWGWYYFRFWFVCRVFDMAPTRILRGTPFFSLYCRLLGAKIGKNVFIGTDRFRAYDMVAIGDNSSINADVHMMAYSVINGMLRIAPISIGANCIIGTRSVLSENSTMENGSELAEQSMLPLLTIVPANSYWEGSPAVEATRPPPDGEGPLSAKLKYTIGHRIAFLAAFLFVMVLPGAVLLPWIILAFEIYVNYGVYVTLCATIPLAALSVLIFCLSVVVVNFIFAHKKGRKAFRLDSYAYIGKWISDTMVQMTLMAVQPIYATLYLPPLLRMLGAKIGKRAEVSTIDHVTADKLVMSEGGFIADSVSLGPPRVRNGVFHVDTITIGARTFIGNSALLPIGTTMGDNCLIGVLSKPPRIGDQSVPNGTSWLGSPPMLLPKRQAGEVFETRKTYEPTNIMIALRTFIEFFKIVLPPAFVSACFVASYWYMSEILAPITPLWLYIMLCPGVIFCASVAISIVAIALKWIIMGRYKPRQTPLWSAFVWGNEFVNGLCENVVYPLLLLPLTGTPWLPMVFRLLGASIGKNVFMETTEITEFDLVHIGDNASLNYGATIQTHLFEDRVMKMSNLLIGKNTTIGPMSVVLYDSEMKEGAQLYGLSLLMKGETLPGNSAWHGVPARAAFYEKK